MEHRGLIRLAGLVLAWSGQVLLLVWLVEGSLVAYPLLDWGYRGLGLVCVLWLLNTQEEPGFQICWLLLLLPFPVMGGLLFLLLGGNRLWTGRKRRSPPLSALCRTEGWGWERSAEVADWPGWAEAKPQLRYLEEVAGFPGYGTGAVCYYARGEQIFPAMLTALEGAKGFIFLEYFILGKGAVWQDILEILKRKAREGVEIRLLYDDAGCLLTLPPSYPKTLATWGIQARVWNPLGPLLSVGQNQRDHRKLLVIDGETAFTGGVNLGDEYLNAVERFGYWKDGGIRIKGAAVASFGAMFLEMWQEAGGNQERVAEEVAYFFGRAWVSEKNFETSGIFQEQGVILPYNNSPKDGEPVGHGVLLNLIGRAKSHLYLTSPYLILDRSLSDALCRAAQAGVDVRLLCPHQGDKKLVLLVTRGHYPPLLRAGVRIYEFSPGFIHSKLVMADGIFATVGSINLDFRSLFLHYENGVWLWNVPCIGQMEADFRESLKASRECSLDPGVLGLADWFWRGLGGFLKIFAPLM